MSESKQSRLAETWIAVLMSITAVATAWSAYQANIWNSIQISKLADAQDEQTRETQSVLEAGQHRMMDSIIAMTIMSALVDGHQSTIDFLLPRIRVDLRNPLQKWIAGDPLHNSALPALPMQMPEYVENVLNKSSAEQKSLHQAFLQRTQAAHQAGATSDNYVLMTVMFAMVLFFSGIASTFRSQRIEVILLLVGTVLLVSTLINLATFPVLMD